ncbi:TMEM175 family protein [Streptococcus caprae]|uniref:TMEM175 family protein n=1 Tax=Streptococcus caprae TaxID=1640501 RepID=A0ABV8CSC5_9STRE
MKKLLDRFDVLSDAIIAIIMTILVLEISAPTKPEELLNFFKEISLFLVSFMLLVNIWYRRAKIIIQAKVTKLECLLLDVFAHALLALFPLTIKMLVAYEDEWVSVLFFGILNVLVITAINLIPLVELGFDWEKGKVSGWIHHYYLRRVWLTILFNLALVALALYLGTYGTYLYLLMPFLDFFASYRKDKRLEEVLQDDNLQSIIAQKIGLKR